MGGETDRGQGCNLSEEEPLTEGEGGKEAGRGRERSRTVLQCQQGAQPVSMEVLLSWAPL